MGTFVGHIVPGLALIFLGLWHMFNTVNAYYLKGKVHYHSRFWYPFNNFSFKFRYMELVSIVTFSIFAITMQVFDLYNLKFLFVMDGLEHATMFLHLAIYASIALVVELTHMPEVLTWFLGALVASVFSQEFFLLHFHSTDHIGLEGHYHWLLQVIVLVSLISSVAMASFTNSILPAFVLSVSVLFQGCWFINMGFMLWVPWLVPRDCMSRLMEDANDMHGAVTCVTDAALSRATALANIQFSLLLAGIMIVAACLCLILARKHTATRQSIEYERLHCGGSDGIPIPLSLNSSIKKSAGTPANFNVYECAAANYSL